MPRKTFITPSAPVLKREPPTGPDWLHEVKHDGWRGQIHLADGGVVIYSNRGNDLTTRFRPVAEAVAKLRARSVIIEAELTACDHEGMPKFGALMARSKRRRQMTASWFPLKVSTFRQGKHRECQCQIVIGTHFWPLTARVACFICGRDFLCRQARCTPAIETVL